MSTSSKSNSTSSSGDSNKQQPIRRLLSLVGLASSKKSTPKDQMDSNSTTTTRGHMYKSVQDLTIAKSTKKRTRSTSISNQISSPQPSEPKSGDDSWVHLYIEDSAQTHGQTEFRLSVTLEEILHGTLKKVWISRERTPPVFEPNSTTIDRETVEYSVQIPKGIHYGTQITLPRAGDYIQHRIPDIRDRLVRADIHLYIAQPEASFLDRNSIHFRRLPNHVDLHLVKSIPLCDSISYGAQLCIPTLDGLPRLISLGPRLITSGMELKISGLGLPYVDDPTKRGDLIVRLDVEYPESMSEEDRKRLAKSLVTK